MSGTQVLEVTGLAFALVGTGLLSIEKLGRIRVRRWIASKSGLLKRQRHKVAAIIALLITCLIVHPSMIQRMSMFSAQVLRLSPERVCTIAILFGIGALLLFMLLMEGRAGYRRVAIRPGSIKRAGRQLRTIITRRPRLFRPPFRLRQLVLSNKDKTLGVFFGSYAFFLVGVPIVVLLMSRDSFLLAGSLAVNLSLFLSASLMVLGYLFATGAQRALGFFVDYEGSDSPRADAELKTFRRLGVSGFVILFLGFLLQIASVLLG